MNLFLGGSAFRPTVGVQQTPLHVLSLQYLQLKMILLSLWYVLDPFGQVICLGFCFVCIVFVFCKYLGVVVVDKKWS